MLHTAVTENPGAHRLLERVHATACTWMEQGSVAGDPAKVDLGEFSTAVNDVLSIAQLRRECVELCAQYTVPDSWCTSRRAWGVFRDRLLDELRDKPLGFPAATVERARGFQSTAPEKALSKKSQALLSALLSQSLPTGSVYLTEVRIATLPTQESRRYWCFSFQHTQGHKVSQLAVPIREEEPASAFASA